MGNLGEVSYFIKMTEELKKILNEAVKSDVGVNFDLGCSDTKRDGYIGIDNRPSKGVDIVWDLEKVPYPIPSNCAGLSVASHIVEHLKPWLMVDIMNEWWRIMKVGGQMLIATPYAGSPMFYQDPTHIKGWNEATIEYFDPFAPMSKGSLYPVYKPLPWKIEKNTWDLTGTLEVLLSKRPDDPSYHKLIAVPK
jgi:hypothetical protein